MSPKAKALEAPENDPVPAEKERACHRIFSAACDLFYRKGIRAVGVEAIAEQAHATKMSLYRTYPSKDELVAQYLRRESELELQRWDERIARHPGDPRKQLSVLFSELTNLTSDPASRGCAMANAAVELQEDHPAKRVIREHKQELGKRMRALCRETGAKHPDQLGDALMLLFRGAFSARLVHEGREQIAVVAAAAKALLDSASLGDNASR